MQREAAVIERQHRKVEHLLHVLQTEIANETRRSISCVGLGYSSVYAPPPGSDRYLSFSANTLIGLVEIQPPPRRPLSRQKQHALATLIKERYEAADRVMRILEVRWAAEWLVEIVSLPDVLWGQEYKIVVGADAAKYLQETIATGKSLLSSSGL